MKRLRERIYIVPRVSGLVFSIFVLLVFALGFVQPGSQGLPQILGIALTVAGVAALIQSNESLRGVEILRCTSVPVPAGEPITLEVTLQNTSSSERVGLTVREGLGWKGKWRGGGMVFLPILNAGETRTVRLPLPTTRRGRFAVPPLWVESVMPVGLCFAWKIFSDGGTYFVYPPPKGRPGEATSLNRGGEAGVQADSGGEDVSGHRLYEAGDPPSRLDWRVYARTGNLVVRTLEEGDGGAARLRWADTDFLPDYEARLEQLSFWVAQCVRENRSFILDLGNGRRDLTEQNLTGCQIALATMGESS